MLVVNGAAAIEAGASGMHTYTVNGSYTIIVELGEAKSFAAFDSSARLIYITGAQL